MAIIAAAAQADMFDQGVVSTASFPAPDDVINMDEELLYASTLSYPRATEFDLVRQLNSVVLNNFKVAKKVQAAQPLIDNHIEWRDDNIVQISKSLELAFPGRWELTTTTDVLEVKWIHSLATELMQCKGSMMEFNMSNFPDTFYRVIIYFPELVITNSAGHVWTIKDYYVIMNLDIRFCVSSLRGYRATKSWREHKLNYTHSHSKSASNDLVPFCFGHTALDTLVAELRYSFDMMKVDLFFQNLPDYLSWESIEGAPYQSIKSLVTYVAPQQRRPEMSDTVLGLMVKSIMSSRLALPINISIIGGVAYSTMSKSKELLRLITAMVPVGYHYPLNDTHLVSVYGEQEDPIAINREIREINEEEIMNSKFVFKGKRVHMQLEEMVVNEEKKIDLELFADTRIMDRLVYHIERNLTAYLNDSYWYGIKERGVH